jgi:hypothetical protein
VRGVTLEGDVDEPSGTMSSGSAAGGSCVPVRAQELRAAEDRVEDIRRVLEALERAEARRHVAREAWRARTHALEIEEHKLRLLQEQVGRCNVAGPSFLISSSFRPSLGEGPTALFYIDAQRAALKRPVAEMGATLKAV